MERTCSDLLGSVQVGPEPGFVARTVQHDGAGFPVSLGKWSEPDGKVSTISLKSKHKVVPSGCNQLAFHHQFRIDTGRTKFGQKTVFCLPVDPMNDPDIIDLDKRRFAWCRQEVGKHQHGVFAQKK